MYHEVFVYVEDRDGSIGYLIPQHLKFCKRNVRTPAWVYNVIMSAWIIVRSGTLDVSSGEFLVENPRSYQQSSWSVFDQAKTLSFLLSQI
jgi:hypothetical protein